MFKSLFQTRRPHNLAIDSVAVYQALAPCSGTWIDVTQLDDFVFSKGLMGVGVAIEPQDGVIYAPINGEVIVMAHTGHAVGLRDVNGFEVLIHIGLKTELLNGKEFTTHVKTGDQVKAGQILISYDHAKQSRRLNLVTIAVIPNTPEYERVDILTTGTIVAGQPIISVTPKISA